ncbi:MAG: restriction endonuclease subunit S [Sulfuritalea sp.]|nr:restriction endonuclease subunit S [Sulfuritalea sp.]
MSAAPMPQRWETRRLRDAVTKLVDGSHNPPAKQENGRPMLSARNVEQGRIVFDDFRFISNDAFVTENARTRITPGDVLLTIVGTIGRSAVVPEGLGPFSLQRSVAVLAPKSDLLPKFLSYQLQSPRIQRHFESHARGTAQKGVYLKTLGETPLLVPPMGEQRNIVAEIEKQFSRLDEAVAGLKRVKANLKRYKAAILKAAVEGRLVPTEADLARREGRDYETGAQLLQRILDTRRSQWQGKGKYKEPAAPDTSDLPELPEGWTWSFIAQISDVASGNTPSGVLDAVRAIGDIPWFKVGDMNHAENQQFLRHSDAWLSSAEVKVLSLRVFQPSTVLFPKRGGAIATNKKRRLSAPGCADLNVMGITPNVEIAGYFFTWFDGVDLARLSDGSNVPQINHKDIEPLTVPIPPLLEQHRIVAEVDRLLSIAREAEVEVEANLKRAANLRQSVLGKAFSA